MPDDGFPTGDDFAEAAPAALIAARHELRGYLFAHLDGKDYRDAMWQQVEPSADETPHGLFGQD